MMPNQFWIRYTGLQGDPAVAPTEDADEMIRRAADKAWNDPPAPTHVILLSTEHLQNDKLMKALGLKEKP